MNTATQAATTNEAGTLWVPMPRNAWYQGFSACMQGESFEEARARGGMYLRGWYAGLSAESDMNTPRMENA